MTVEQITKQASQPLYIGKKEKKKWETKFSLFIGSLSKISISGTLLVWLASLADIDKITHCSSAPWIAMQIRTRRNILLLCSQRRHENNIRVN